MPSPWPHRGSVGEDLEPHSLARGRVPVAAPTRVLLLLLLLLVVVVMLVVVVVVVLLCWYRHARC